MTNTLMKEFIDFVNDQTPYAEIDHDGGWDNCAIGKFFDQKFPSASYSEKINGICEFAAEIFEVDLDEMVSPNPNYLRIYKNLNTCRYDTYGELAVQLNSLD